jgi:hypothetical protein
MFREVFSILPGLLLIAGAAWAVDLTGTYEGRRVCKQLEKSSGEKAKIKIAPTMHITRVGDKLRMDLLPGLHYEGTVIDDARVPATRAQAALVSCSPSQDASGHAEVLHVECRGPGVDGVTLNMKGVSAYSTSSHIGNCIWKYKRTSTANPNVSTCP